MQIVLLDRAADIVGRCRDLHDFTQWMQRDFPESLLGSADPYDDTRLSGSKLDQFLAEWEEMEALVVSWAEREFWDCIHGMAMRSKRDNDVTLVLYGD